MHFDKGCFFLLKFLCRSFCWIGHGNFQYKSWWIEMDLNSLSFPIIKFSSPILIHSLFFPFQLCFASLSFFSHSPTFPGLWHPWKLHLLMLLTLFFFLLQSSLNNLVSRIWSKHILKLKIISFALKIFSKTWFNIWKITDFQC